MKQVALALDLVESAYAIDVDETSWLRGLASAAAPLLDEGTGLHVFAFDLQREPLGRSPVLAGGVPAWQSAWRENWWVPVVGSLSADQLRFAAQFASVFYATHLWAAAAQNMPNYRALFAKLGSSGWGHAFGEYTEGPVTGKLYYPDSLNVVAVDASGSGIALVANRARRATSPPSDAQMALWNKLAGHVSAAQRLRSRVAASTAPVEAVITPHGRIEHAEGVARSRVALAAFARRGARHRSRPHRAPTRHARSPSGMEGVAGGALVAHRPVRARWPSVLRRAPERARASGPRPRGLPGAGATGRGSARVGAFEQGDRVRARPLTLDDRDTVAPGHAASGPDHSGRARLLGPGAAARAAREPLAC